MSLSIKTSFKGIGAILSDFYLYQLPIEPVSHIKTYVSKFFTAQNWGAWNLALFSVIPDQQGMPWIRVPLAGRDSLKSSGVQDTLIRPFTVGSETSILDKVPSAISGKDCHLSLIVVSVDQNQLV